MFKKILTSIIALMILLSSMPVMASTNSWYSGGFHFAYVGGLMTITGYTGSPGNITIPARAPNSPTYSWVYVIGDDAFANRNLNNVTFQSGTLVHTIGRDAFRRTNLNSITLPQTLTTIGNGAFEDNNLDRITIPANVEHIGNWAFADNPLRYAHFEHLNGNNVSLGNNVFNRTGTTGTNFIITRRPEAINFGRNWYPPHSTYSTDDAEARESDWRWTTLAGNNAMITGFEPNSPLATATRIEIPAQIAGRNVRRIANRSFDSHPNLEEVIIPDTVVAIYPRAFNDNRWLRSAFFRHGDGNTVEVSRDAFLGSHNNFSIFFPYGARGFTTPTWNGFPAAPDDIDGIWETSPLGGGVELMVTRYNGGASVVEIPSFIDGRPVRYVGSQTFMDNNNITEIVFPDTIVHIQANAVLRAPNLRVARLEHMQADTIDVSGLAFSNVHQDFTIIFPSGAQGFTTPLWSGFPAERDLITAYWDHEISGGAATITAYLGDENIVEIPAYIGGAPVRTIATGAFRDNNTIERVIIPANVNRIEPNAFHYCSNLYAAELLHTNANQLNNFSRESFVGVAPHFRLVVRRNASGFSHPTWNGYFTELETDAMTNREGNFEFIIRREPAPGMAQATRDVVTITRYFGATQDVEIPETLRGFPVVGIGDFAFIQNHHIRRITIPSSVTDFGHSSFLSATNLEFAHFRHPNAQGLDLSAGIFRYTASNFTILYLPNAVGFTTPIWQGWPARPTVPADNILAPPGAPTTPVTPGTPGTPSTPGGLMNPHILTSRTLNAHDPHMTRDGTLLHAPIFRLEPFPGNPQLGTSYVMTRVIADILGLETTFNDVTRTATFRGYNAQNQYIIMEIVIGQTVMHVNGVPQQVRASAGVVPAIVRDDRLFVPVLVFQDVFGVTVQWNPANSTVTVNP